MSTRNYIDTKCTIWTRSYFAEDADMQKVIEQIKDYVLLMLGAPVIQIELDQQQLDACVDLSLQVLEEYAPREYFQFYIFNTKQ